MSRIENIATLWKTFRQHDGLLWATSLTYTTLFAIVPLFAVALSLFKALGGFDQVLGNTLPIISAMLDPSHKIQVMQYILGYVGTIHAGALGLIGSLVFFLASIPLYLNAEQAVNALWGKVENRPMWLRFVLCWVVITLGPVAIVIALSMLSFMDRLLPNLPFIKSIMLVMIIFIILVFFLIYKIVPNTAVRNKPALIAALTSGLAWIAAYYAYQFYIRQAMSSFTIYGSLGAIPIFLLWIYINWIILLMGVQLTRHLQYPRGIASEGSTTPTAHLLAAAAMLKIIFANLQNGVYFSEEICVRDAIYPPEVTSAVIRHLLLSGIIKIENGIILPLKGQKDITLSKLISIFIGPIEKDVLELLSLDVSALGKTTLADFP